MRNKKIILLIAFIALVILGIFLTMLLNKNGQYVDNGTDNNGNKEVIKGNVLYMKDWDFYKNESLGLSIQHPKDVDPIEYLDGANQKVVNFKYDNKGSSSYSLTIIDNKDKKFENDKYRVIYSNPNDFNIKKETVYIDDVVGTRYIVDDNAASGENRADDIIFEKEGKTYIISAAIKDANFENFYRTFDFLSD